MEKDQFTVHRFEEKDWEIFRDMRLHSLKTEPRVFSRTYEEVAIHGPEKWRADLCREREVYFGLFDQSEKKLIGITGIFPDKDDSSGKTAKFGISYILPEYRGQNLSRLLYQARIDWVMDQASYDTIKIAHRRSNEISRRANQHFGFVFIDTKPDVIWPDGGIEDELVYAIDLRKQRAMNMNNSASAICSSQKCFPG